MADFGRPSKYDPSFCDAVIDFMADGYSLSAFAGSIGVAYSTAKLWETQHEDFSAAVRIGRSKAVHWWEQRGRAMALGVSTGNATAVIFGLKNRAPDEWKDKTEQTLSGPDGGPVVVQRIERVVLDPK